MKKLLFGMMAALTLAASCQNDFDYVPNGEETAQVTFNVGAPEIATRAFSDGTTATVLQYAVYNAEGNELTDLTVTNGEIHGSTTVNLQLTTGNTYSVIFWAAAENAPYTVDFDAKTMTVNYANAVSNDETRDAFYAYHEFTVTGSQTETVYLKRPFAQLNIGTSDYDAAEAAGYAPAYSYVKVPVSAELNLVDGSVDAAAEVEFKLASIPANEEFPVAGYDYLSMNYLLVAAEKEVVDIEFGYSENNTTVEKSRIVGSVPVQRNHRTNIYGQLLTSDVDINVEIKPGYDDDEYNNEHGFIVAEGKVSVSSAEGLQILAERMANGELLDDNIVLDGDIDLSVTTRSSAVYNWTPMGTSEKPFTGTFDGQGHTIKNLNIVEETAKEGKAYIGFFGYAKNATIKNVTFENVNLNIPCLDIDHSQGHIGAVAGSLEGTSTIENVTVKGDIKVYATQEANGASRVAVVAGGNSYGNVTMENVHVIANEGSYLIANNNAGALAGQLQGKSVCKNCSSNIDVTVNKFFAGGIIGLAAGDQLFENCHTTGDIAVLAGRSGKAHDHYRVGGIAGGWADGAKNVCTLVNCSYTGKLTGINSDGSVADKFDYLGYVGRGYALNGCAGSKVVIDGIEFVQIGNTAAEAGVYSVTNAEGEDVVAAGSKEDLPTIETNEGTKIDTNFDENVTLFDDITLSAGETNANSGYAATGVKVSNGAVLDGQGNTLTVNDANSTWACCVAVTGGTIKNLTVAGAMRGIFMPGADGDVYIDNVIFKDVVYTFNSDAGNKNYGVYISNCTINGWTSHSDVHKEVVYTNCSFGEGSGYAFCRPYGPTSFVGCDFKAGFKIDARGKVTFENCTFGGVALTAENLATLVTSRIENASVK